LLCRRCGSSAVVVLLSRTGLNADPFRVKKVPSVLTSRQTCRFTTLYPAYAQTSLFLLDCYEWSYIETYDFVTEALVFRVPSPVRD
jgi:hypothetical protein